MEEDENNYNSHRRLTSYTAKENESEISMEALRVDGKVAERGEIPETLVSAFESVNGLAGKTGDHIKHYHDVDNGISAE
ncbi:MAG: hypothetical protein ABEK36_05415 [Candidatus Aenigmatarchaeota archaeon]